MNRFEDDLKSALSRRDAPVGFEDRVMSRIPSASNRTGWMRRWSHSWMAAAAAALIAILGAGVYEQQRAEQVRRQGERAKAELVFALEVASQKLSHTRAKVLKNSEEGL